jgi:transcriptional regulator with XRE-family HTH domain
MTIGENIKYFREKQGLTQEELAEIVGIAQGNLSRIENDKQSFSIRKADLIALALDISITELVEGEKVT